MSKPLGGLLSVPDLGETCLSVTDKKEKKFSVTHTYKDLTSPQIINNYKGFHKIAF